MLEKNRFLEALACLNKLVKRAEQISHFFQFFLCDCVVLVRNQISQENEPLHRVQRLRVYQFSLVKQFKYFLISGRKSEILLSYYKFSQIYCRIDCLKALH